jgi:dTDP-4-amino-4,6-dideoxygalactose transaminase
MGFPGTVADYDRHVKVDEIAGQVNESLPVRSASEPIQILNLKAQYLTIKDEIDDAIRKVLDRQNFILGAEVATLEQEVAHYCGTKHAVGVASGTDALILALKAAGVGPGDEVIVPAFTFVATADSVTMLGATPVFADIDPLIFALNPDVLDKLVTPKTKAIVPVHLYGHPAPMLEIKAFAKRHGVFVVEDTAQAMGATYAGVRAGSMGALGCLSFFPSKNLGAYGDGGMIVTSEDEYAANLRMLRSHGSEKKYRSEFLGWNSRLDELQAAILRVKLPHLDRWNEARKRNAALYCGVLSGIEGVGLPVVQEGCGHVFHQFTIRVRNREMVQALLKEAGIQTAVHYPIPLHLQPMFKALGYRRGDLPVAETACNEVLSLPMYPELEEEQISLVGRAIKQAVEAASMLRS